MILGAGCYQKPLIQVAIDIGLEVHVCSIKGNYPGIQIAPFYHEIDISNSSDVLELARNLEVDGIITTATDVGLESMGRVIEELGVPGTSLSGHIACSNKKIMKDLFQKNAIPSAEYAEIFDASDAIQFFENQLGPCVIKPTDSSGSRGVIKIDNALMIEDALKTAKNFSKSGSIIIEEWLEGEEFGAQAIVFSEEICLIILHSDLTTLPPNKIPIGHGCPHPKESEIFPKVSQIITKAILALGIRNSVCNIDLIMTKEGPKIIEMTCRMGGTRLPEVCGDYWGINMYEIALNIALGIKPLLPKEPLGMINAAHNLHVRESGLINKVGEMNEDYKWVIESDIEQPVFCNEQGLAEIGYVQAKGINPTEVLLDAEKAAKIFCKTTTMQR